MILVTGGAGFIGANFVLDWLAASRRAGRQSRQADVRGQPRQPAVARGRRPPRVRARRHRRRGAGGRAAARASPARDREFRGGIPRGPVDPRPGGVHRDERRRDVQPARRDARVVDGAARAGARRVPLPARVDRRGVRLARADRSRVHGDHGVCAEQPLFGVEGGVRPSGARLPPHVRAADAHVELLEQLRPAPVPGEADPADDRQRARAAARCRSTATARTSATGSTSATTARRCARCSRAGARARPTTSAAMRR